MNATTHFIKDRADTLLYEAVHFPATTETALAWLDRALDWAEKRGLKNTADYIRLTTLLIKHPTERQNECRHVEHFAPAGQTMDTLPMWAGEGEI
jgi:hypothetical protein